MGLVPSFNAYRLKIGVLTIPALDQTEAVVECFFSKERCICYSSPWPDRSNRWILWFSFSWFVQFPCAMQQPTLAFIDLIKRRVWSHFFLCFARWHGAARQEISASSDLRCVCIHAVWFLHRVPFVGGPQRLLVQKACTTLSCALQSARYSCATLKCISASTEVEDVCSKSMRQFISFSHFIVVKSIFKFIFKNFKIQIFQIQIQIHFVYSCASLECISDSTQVEVVCDLVDCSSLCLLSRYRKWSFRSLLKWRTSAIFARFTSMLITALP